MSIEALNLNLDLYEDAAGKYHYQAYTPGRKNARRAPTLCGLEVKPMRKAAWFIPGDRRGSVHYDRGCDACRANLADLDSVGVEVDQ